MFKFQLHKFERIAEAYPGPLPKKHRSIAVWPDTISVGNIAGKNESDDIHDSQEAAEAVCRLLRREVFGGEGKVFPVSTRVEPVEEI
jgi:hypothetical protein